MGLDLSKMPNQPTPDRSPLLRDADSKRLNNALIHSEALGFDPGRAYEDSDLINNELKKISQTRAPERERQKREFGYESLKQYGAYIPWLGLSAFKGVTSYFLENIFFFKEFGTDRAIAEAIEYWREKTGSGDILIPDFGFEFKDGKLRVRHTIPPDFLQPYPQEKKVTSSVKDIVGATAEVAGAVAGPVGAAFKAGRLVVNKFAAEAGAFYQSIARGMITGALLGEGKKDQTLENMALFGVFEPIAYFLGRAPELGRRIRESTAWRNMTVKERGLMVQELDDVAGKAADYLQVMKERGAGTETLEFLAETSEGRILRDWNNPTWRSEALNKRTQIEKDRVRAEADEAIRAKAREEAKARPEPEVPAEAEVPRDAEFLGRDTEGKYVYEDLNKQIYRLNEKLPKVPAEVKPAGEKQPWEMTREEYRETATLEDISREIEAKAGTQNPQEIADYYSKKYGLPRIRVILDDSADIRTASTSKAILKGEKVYNIHLPGRLTRRLSEILRHEIEHIIDKEIHGHDIGGIGRGAKDSFAKHEHETFTHDYSHRSAVKQALSEGKPVPPEVLADYPELAKKAPEPTPPGRFEADLRQEIPIEDIKEYEQLAGEARRRAEVKVEAEIDEELLVDEEIDILRKMLGRKPRARKDLKKVIREQTGQVKIGKVLEMEEGKALKIKIQAEAKAAREAFTAGKREAALKAKERQKELLEGVRERKQTRQEIKKIVKALKAIDTAKMSPQEAEPIKALLGGLDLVKRTEKTILNLSRTRNFLEENPDAELPERVLERLKLLDKRNLNDISLDELRSVYIAVMHYTHLNKTKNRIKVGREQKRKASALQDSITEMKPVKEVESAIISSQPKRIGGARRAGILIKETMGIRHDHYDLIIESLAGANSTMDKVLFQGIKEGVIKQLRYKQETFTKFQKDLKETDLFGGDKITDIAGWLKEKITTGQFSLSRGERMALYRHSLNPDNKRAILEGGFGFRSSATPNKVYPMTEKEMNEIIKSLTPEELAFAGKPADNLFENQYKELSSVFYKKNGYPLPKEENYYPKDTMPLARGLDFEKQEALEAFKKHWTRIGIPKGMLIERERVKLPIYLNSMASDINKSVMRSAAYVGLELPLSNASKLLYDKNFRRELSDRYGPETWREIEKGIRDIADDWQSYSTVEELLLRMKNNVTTAILGLNPFVMTKQVLSLPLYLPYVKPEYLVQGAIDYMNNSSDVTQRHKLYSPEYLERLEGGYSRDVADIFKAGADKRLFGGKKEIREKVMGGIKLFDRMAVTPGMQGAVLQVLDEFKTGTLSREVSIALDMTNKDILGLTAEDKMKLAYKYADYVTERTQPMFSPEHRSSLSRGEPVEKLFTMFGAFTNQALNLIRRTLREAQRTGDRKAYDKLAKVLFLLLVVNPLGVFLIDELRNRIYQRKRGGHIAGRILGSWASYFFFIRDLASSVISKVERGTFRGYDVELPVSRIPELMADVIANGIRMTFETNPRKREKIAMRFVDDALNLLLMFMGIPYETPKKLGKAAIEAGTAIAETND